MVKGKEKAKNNNIEIISCQFKQVSGIKEGKIVDTKKYCYNKSAIIFMFYETAKEERFGIITLKVDVIKSNQSKIKKGLSKLETSVIEHKLSRRPARLIPPKLLLYNIKTVITAKILLSFFIIVGKTKTTR